MNSNSPAAYCGLLIFKKTWANGFAKPLWLTLALCQYPIELVITSYLKNYLVDCWDKRFARGCYVRFIGTRF